MKRIRPSISKEEISLLPVVTFEGRIVTIQTESDAAKAVDYLLTRKRVGVDTETRPSFVSGKFYKVALLQVSTDEVCFLFRLNRLDFPPSIRRFLEDDSVMKIGLSLKDDWNALRRRSEFKPGNFMELQHYVSRIGIEDKSLQKIYAILFGQRISKAQRLSNWEAETLNDKQKLYAATDAWACLMIYRYVEELQQSGDFYIEEIIKEKENTAKEEDGQQEGIS